MGPVWIPQVGHEVLGVRPNLEERNVDLDGLEVGNVRVRQVQEGEAADAPNPVRLQGMSICEFDLLREAMKGLVEQRGNRDCAKRSRSAK